MLSYACPSATNGIVDPFPEGLGKRMNDTKDTQAMKSEGRAGRRDGVSNELVGILTMGVAMIGVSLASWTTLHAEIGGLREDMGQLRSDMRADMDQMRSDVRADMDRLRTDIGKDMAQLRTDIHADMEQLRSDLHGDMEQLRSDVGDDVQELRTDIGALGVSVGRLDDRMRAVETRLAVVETQTGSASVVPPADLGEA